MPNAAAPIVDATFAAEMSSIDTAIGEIDRRIRSAEDNMKALDDPKRKKTIKEFYFGKLQSFANELSITEVPPKLFNSIRPKVSESGSAKPRLLLAYYYAILHTIAEFSTACFCPIVIDTPIQQDQDEANARRMIRFSIENRPAGSQLILTSGNLHGVSHDGINIAPSVKKSLLVEDQFDHVSILMRTFFDRALE